MRHMIFTSFGPWEGDRAYRQELWCHQWHKQKDCHVCILFQGQDRTMEMASRYGFTLITDIKKASSIGLPSEGLLMSSIFKTIAAQLPPSFETVAYTGDSLPFTPYMGSYFGFMDRVSGKRFQAFARGRDIQNWGPYVRATYDETIDQIQKYLMYKGVVHYPGADTFCWSRSVFEELAKEAPTMDFLYGGSEEFWWVWGFNKEDIKNYEFSCTVNLVHLNHEPPMHRASMDGNLGAQSKDPNIQNVYKHIPPFLKDVWDNMVPDVKGYDNGIFLVDWNKKKKGSEENGRCISSSGQGPCVQANSKGSEHGESAGSQK